MLAITPPMAGVCLIMDDVNSQLLQDLSHALPWDTSADQGVMVGDLANRCFSGAGNASASTSLFDIAYGRHSVTDQKVYLRDALVQDFHDPLAASFQQLSSNQGVSTLSTHAAFTTLRSSIASNPADVLLVPDATQMQADLLLSSLALDSVLQLGYTTTSRCANHSVSSGASPGLQGFVDRLLQMGTPSQNLTECLKTVDCSGAPGGDERKACDAGNMFIALKAEVIQNATYRCDVFKHSNGSACDPKDMTLDYQGAWQNDCLQTSSAGSTLQIKQVPCSLQEFVIYLQDFDERMSRAATRLDAAVAQADAMVDIELRRAMEGPLSSIASVAAESNCNYMPTLYQDMLEGACHQGVDGLVTLGYLYVSAGIMMSIIVFAMYTLWRSHVHHVKNSQAVEETPIQEAGDEP